MPPLSNLSDQERRGLADGCARTSLNLLIGVGLLLAAALATKLFPDSPDIAVLRNLIWNVGIVGAIAGLALAGCFGLLARWVKPSRPPQR